MTGQAPADYMLTFKMERAKRLLASQDYSCLLYTSRCVSENGYMALIEMMRHEGIMEKGHLQINKNIITWLTDLHLQLLRCLLYTSSNKVPITNIWVAG